MVKFCNPFNKLNINTKEVLEALVQNGISKYMPGLVKSFIGVDPYYLTFKAKEIGYKTQLISAGRNINEFMHEYLIEKILFYKSKRKIENLNEEILLLGLSYKSNCGDIRNSQLIKLVNIFKSRDMICTIVDPKVDKDEVKKSTGLICFSDIPANKKYSIIIMALYFDKIKIITKNNLLEFHKDTLIFDLTNNLIGEDIINL